MSYAARQHYTDPGVVERYETDRYTGLLGRHRWAVEQRAIRRVLSVLPPGQFVLDCPVGNGRWVGHLVRAGHSVFGADISAPMLRAAAVRCGGPAGDAAGGPGGGAAGSGTDRAAGHVAVRATGLVRADAELLPLRDGSCDYVFSHALTKHLPVPVADKVFAEFARVARRGVVCSFSVLSGPYGALWRARRIADGHGRSRGDLAAMALRHGLTVRAVYRCTTVIGVERTMLFERRCQR